ncbi:MAG: hypothetical protein LAN83_14555 [Acidobacteriia bacterium]|nr:hypothetical protein [Terriglobia bacterium]
MSKLQFALAFSVSVLAISLVAPAYGRNTTTPPAPPDSTLYTNYFTGAGYQNFTWIVCGSTQDSSGCYGAGSLGPFGRGGALMEGNPSTNGNTVTRAIYVVDIASGSTGNGVTLYVYKKTDTVTTSSDTVTVTLLRTVNLPLTGGSTALCSMAANNRFIFIGTDQSPQAVRVQKNNLSTLLVGGFSPPINVTSITADKYGYVTVTFGGFTGGESGNYIFGPDGSGVGDGGGAWFMLNTVTGVSTTTLPPSSAEPAVRLQVWPKTKQPSDKN